MTRIMQIPPPTLKLTFPSLPSSIQFYLFCVPFSCLALSSYPLYNRTYILYIYTSIFNHVLLLPTTLYILSSSITQFLFSSFSPPLALLNLLFYNLPFFPSLLCKKSLLFSTHLQYSIYQLFMSALLSSAFASMSLSLSSLSFFYILFDLFPFFKLFHLVYEYNAFVVASF